MGRFRSGGVFWAVAILCFWSFSACGGGGKPGPPLFAGKVLLTPSSNTSLVLGGTLVFFSTVQTASGTTLNTPVAYSSSDTSILNIASNGVACAGRWDQTFSTCSPGATGVVKITATALGSASIPTYVFVHPPIDSITVTGILLDGVPVQEPCLSQSQSMTLEAHAFSRGIDVTASVGPFTWSQSNPTVATLTPVVNNSYTFPTNRVTATAAIPGITQIFASASGVSSTSFQQPTYSEMINGSSVNSPVLDFFSTCPIANIALEVGAVGTRQTSFSVTKGTGVASQTVFATITDVMGNSTLVNNTGSVVLSKIPLTWLSSQPGAISVASGCTESCQLTLNSPGAASITAACSPPTCNVGFPTTPQSLASQTQIDTCNAFFQPLYPKFGGCQELIPFPVYSSNVFINPPNVVTNPPIPPVQLSPSGAVSGVVSGTPGAAAIFAASTGCAHEAPNSCSSAAYYLSSAKASVGNENPTQVSPNSLMFDLAGDKIIMGSDFGAQIINPGNFGSSSSAFTSLGAITGKALATSNTGVISMFSDTIHTPNQVFAVNTGNAGSVSDTALNISNASVAAFSPDSLKAYIVGGSAGSSLYAYSPLQALKGPVPLTGPGKAIAFAPNGAFAFVAQASAGAGANLTAYATCNNKVATDVNSVAANIALPFDPILMRVLPNLHIDGSDSQGHPIPDGVHVLVLDSTGFDIITSTISPPPAGSLCPQQLTFTDYTQLPPAAIQRIELGQGTLNPVNFFASPDATQLYIVNANSSSIVIYSFISGSVIGGIELAGGVTPLSADMTVDGGTIAVAGSDGMLHEVSTAIGGSDLVQLSFPNLPNFFNGFCSAIPTSGIPCILNSVLVRP
ncbi:MAG: hypothetical protein ACJ72H_04220 [Candidatus Sulfotelmatobacter sp.]